ncbi:transcriptional regulator, MarR family [Rhizobium sp. PDO1-076]|uniref:MarR family winged helix-turn-helix transcriptional regulator n=1 Tax=Rhizobium sp. PDO1-076 TaxID=1125979 RepID=UPI00024E3747|nr:MarR family winged helix-turn-helix transcriptional regulator [Rhizobium sp. PDO1-076]EHS52713.1 transcriptional regulator, MarR family [Rhizobium sp. PDO1-076]
MHNTHVEDPSGVIHGALVDIVGIMNSPQRDAAMIREAGISLDRALFPLLLMVARKGPISVTDLADLVGRDHSTVSRQIPKLEELGLIERRSAGADRRVREAVITPAGTQMTAIIDGTRKQLAGRLLKDWSEEDLQSLAVLIRKLADDVLNMP